MILQIVEVRQEVSQSLTLVGNPYYAGQTTDVSEVKVAIPEVDLLRAIEKLGLNASEELVGTDMAVAMDEKKVFVLVDLEAKCYLTNEINKRDIMGIVVEASEHSKNKSELIIWTPIDDRSVACECSTSHIHEVGKIFGYEDVKHFWHDPAFYSYQNKRAYIGLRIR